MLTIKLEFYTPKKSMIARAVEDDFLEKTRYNMILVDFIEYYVFIKINKRCIWTF